MGDMMNHGEAQQLLRVTGEATPEQIDKIARSQIGVYQRRIDNTSDPEARRELQEEIRKIQQARDLLLEGHTFSLETEGSLVSEDENDSADDIRFAPLGKRLYQESQIPQICSHCEKAQPPHAKFCSECGKPLRKQAEASSSEATESHELAPCLIPEMVLIPEGWFLRGSPVGEGNDNETPQRRIWLDSYYIGRYTVTNAQYREFVYRTGYRHPRHWGDSRFNQDDQPVVGVTWEDAMAYCAWLSQITGRRFTLPSEAQWEKAARGTDTRKYPWGNRRPSRRRVHASHRRNLGRPAPSASYPKGASPYGVINMLGNVLEWCLDVYERDYYAASPERNPVNLQPTPGPTEPGQPRRKIVHVLRGSSWIGACAPLTYRFITPTANLCNVGFRCAEIPEMA